MNVYLVETLTCLIYHIDTNFNLLPLGGFLLILLGCGGVTGLNNYWHPVLIPQYLHSLIQITCPCLSWVCST